MFRIERARRGVAICLGVILLSGSGSVAGLPLVGDGAAPGAEVDASGEVSRRLEQEGAGASQYREAFGYELGEERRYVLEPQDSLRSGESASWSIRLDDISGEGEDIKMVFALEHERTEPIGDMFGGLGARLQVVDVESRVTLNRFGFPLRVVMSERHDLSGETGSQSDIRTTIFTFDGERYVKKVRLNGREWKFTINVANHDDLDREARSGMYLFLPSALTCLGRRGEAGRPAYCADGEPAFANPGLLSIVLPVMWEEQVNKKKFLFFVPSGIGTTPAGLYNMSRWTQLERDQLRNLTRYYRKIDIEFEEFVEAVEVGPRTVDVWKFDASGAMRAIYTDADGVVLKVDIDPHPVTNGKRWIRLLYPSEY